MSLEATTSLNQDPAAPTTPSADLVEPQTTEVAGQKMVPLAALHEERRTRQELKAERERLAAENAELRKTKENWDVVEPYIPLLATHPEITGKKAPAAPQPVQDPELLEVADAFGLYDQAGQPDLARAAKVQTLVDKRAGGKAQEIVRPVAKTAEAMRGQALRERAYQVVDKSNRPFAAKQHIDAVLNQIPDEALNEDLVKWALMAARGMGMPASGEPLHTEGSGGGPLGTGKSLSSLERAAARARGLSDDQWIKARDNDSDVLE